MKAHQILQRNQLANAAYESLMVKARLLQKAKTRIPYPVAVKQALAAYDKVIAKYGPLEAKDD